MTCFAFISSFIVAALAAVQPAATDSITLRTRTTGTAQPPAAVTVHFTNIYIESNRRRDETVVEVSGQKPFTTATIQDGQLKRTVFLNPSANTYEITPFPDKATIRADAERTRKMLEDIRSGKIKPPQVVPGAPVVTIETIDTGERKEMAGLTLRHIRQTETRPVVDGKGGRTETRDGWYVDLPSPLRGYMQGLQPGNNYGFLTTLDAGPPSRMEFKGNTSPALPTPVEETKITKFSDGPTIVDKTELIELSRAPIDPKVFEIPKSYDEALHTPGGGRDMSQPDTFLNRLRAYWLYLMRGLR